ncbi:MAG TPA: sigma-70 family RNA polymerase sigma factor [Pyrinomonadaceae bacterium]|jgi:RNA polymerase sigma-70 factor (ECF subfamily)|nr:sigma-70 family RNA polymerase sigma factor [Pyrinomonadaceae bacterium]
MTGSEPAQQVRLKRPDEAEERRLIEAAQRDRASFGDVYERYFALVYAYVARRVRDRAATEDLTSEVFRKALANINRFKWTGAPFGAWLLRIASNLIADRARRQAKNGVHVDESSLAVGPRHGTQASSPQTQQADLEESERRAWVISKVDELPEDQRRVVRMRFAEEKSINEIALELGRSEGAIKQLQFRALQSLRAKLDIN